MSEMEEQGSLQVSRVFANVNKSRPMSYWDYDNYEIKYGNIEDYYLVSRIGRGKYSDVFVGHDKEKKSVVVKVLKPVRMKKIKREISILENLREGVNIIKMHCVVLDVEKQCPAIIFEHVALENFGDIGNKLTPQELSFYIYELLKALYYAHSRGIMHRDVKPHNIVVDNSKRQLKLIDWGLAEYYHPGQAYNVRVASRYYKGPELLVDYEYYDYSLDMWGLGCMLAQYVFKKEPFFFGSNNVDQLFVIVDVLGVNDLRKYRERYNIKSLPEALDLPRKTRRNLEEFAHDNNQKFVKSSTVDFLNKLLQYDHKVLFLCLFFDSFG